MAGTSSQDLIVNNDHKNNMTTSTAMTHIQSIDNEIKLLISKKTKKKRPSPSLLSKITGIEISAAPSKSFRKKHKREEPEIDVSRTMSVLFEPVIEPKPFSTWVTSRIAYDIDNEDNDEDAYYPPVTDQMHNSTISIDLQESQPERIGDSLALTEPDDVLENIKPKLSRKNRVKEIANQWSSLISKKKKVPTATLR